MEQEVETLDTILECAADVLRDCFGEDEADTRIVRMARYLVGHLGGPPYQVDRVGSIARATMVDGRGAWRCGDLLGFGTVDKCEWPPNGIPVPLGEDYVVALLRVMEPAPEETEH